MAVAHSGTGVRRQSPEVAERVVIRAAEPGDVPAVRDLVAGAGMSIDPISLCEFHPLRRMTLVAERGGRLIGLAAYQRWGRTGAMVRASITPACPSVVAATLLVSLVQVGNALGIGSFFTADDASLAAMMTACRLNPEALRAAANPTGAAALFEAPGETSFS